MLVHESRHRTERQVNFSEESEQAERTNEKIFRRLDSTMGYGTGANIRELTS
jgi:hypothetical protein